jgi:hypothetical protein
LGSLVPKAEQNTNHSQAAFVGHSVIPRERLAASDRHSLGVFTSRTVFCQTQTRLTVKSQERPQDKVRVDQAQSAGWGRR